nr:Unknown Function [uncultured bacterium]
MLKIDSFYSAFIILPPPRLKKGANPALFYSLKKIWKRYHIFLSI